VFAKRHDVRRKVVLITGAARGLGAGLARRLAGQGAKLALVGLEGEELRKVAADCGADATAWEADVTDWDALRAAVNAVIERYGRIDVVVANAGIAAAGFVRSIDPAAFEKVIEVDLLGVWRTVRTTLPHLIESRGYCLIVSSMAAVVQLPGNAPYNAAKAGVEAFGNTLRAEVRHLGVGIGIAHPTWISTEMVRGGDEHPVFGPLRRNALGPLGRTYSVPFAVDALAEGVVTRARTVHIPRNLLAAKVVRALIPPVVERLGARHVPAADRAALADVERRGARASAPVGPGGKAAMAVDKAAQKGPEKGSEKGPEKGSEKGPEKGSEKGPEKGSEKAEEQPKKPAATPSRRRTAAAAKTTAKTTRSTGEKTGANASGQTGGKTSGTGRKTAGTETAKKTPGTSSAAKPVRRTRKPPATPSD